MDGTVAASDTFEVYAPIGGTVAKVSAEVGQEVGADDVLYALKTTKVYAEEAGTVTYTTAQRIGRGTVSRVSPTAVTGSGSIVRYAVKDGDQVKRGDLLLETLDGTFDGYYMSGTDILAGDSGMVGSLNASQGGSIQGGSVVAVLYPRDGMRVEATVPEDSRSGIKVGDKVMIELEADESKTFEGTVTMISGIATASQGEGEVTYKVLIDFTPDTTVRYGMSVVVTTVEAEEESAEAEDEEVADTRSGGSLRGLRRTRGSADAGGAQRPAAEDYRGQTP